jgi:hypothetical protein
MCMEMTYGGAAAQSAPHQSEREAAAEARH